MCDKIRPGGRFYKEMNAIIQNEKYEDEKAEKVTGISVKK